MTSDSKCFIDTNLFVRFLTNDDPQKAGAVENLLLKAKEGKVRLVTSHLVIAELVWVLASYYSVSNSTICELLKAVLNTKGLSVENSNVIEDTLEIFKEENIDFVDAYIIAFMRSQKISRIYSYNKKHLSKFQDINRLEP